MTKLLELKISCLVKMLQHEYMTKLLFILQYRLSVQLLTTERKVQTLNPTPPPTKGQRIITPKGCNSFDRQNIPRSKEIS